MANPATLLHELLIKFRTPRGRLPLDIRRESFGDDAGVAKAQRLAMAHISAIEELLKGLDGTGRRVAPYEKALSRWQNWVNVYPSCWVHQADSDFMDNEADLDLLAALSDMLDTVIPESSEDDRQSLGDVLKLIRELLTEESDLPKDLQRHIFGLLTHAQTCLDEYATFGDFELRAAMDRLLVSVNLASHVSKNPKWQTAKEKFWYPTMTGVIVGAPSVVISAITAANAASGAG